MEQEMKFKIKGFDSSQVHIYVYKKEFIKQAHVFT